MPASPARTHSGCAARFPARRLDLSRARRWPRVAAAGFGGNADLRSRNFAPPKRAVLAGMVRQPVAQVSGDAGEHRAPDNEPQGPCPRVEPGHGQPFSVSGFACRFRTLFRSLPSFSLQRRHSPSPSLAVERGHAPHGERHPRSFAPRTRDRPTLNTGRLGNGMPGIRTMHHPNLSVTEVS